VLPKSKRLKTADFKALRKARTFHTAHLFVRAVPTVACRVAAVVSTAVTPSAVIRNTLRRRIYSAAASNLKGGAPRALIAVSAKKGAEKLTLDELARELDTALLKIAELG